MESAISNIVSAILIAAPLTFIAGWLACKSLLRMHREQTDANAPAQAPAPETTREFDPHATIQRPDGRDLLAQALKQATAPETKTVAQADVTPTGADAEDASHELAELKEALAERDHQISELRSQMQDLPDFAQLPEQQPTGEANEDLAQELEQLKHESLLASGRLHRAEADADKHKRHMQSWRQRAKPLIKQCRQQRRIILELREQLRSGVVETKPGITAEIPADDLQTLRGIGPALEKRMNSRGIYCYRQIAAMSEDELVTLGQSLGIGRNRTLSAEWLAQAKELVGADATQKVSQPAATEPA